MTISWLVSMFFCTGVALSAFGATYWPPQLGYLAASPGVLLIAMAFTLLLPLAPWRRRNSPANRAWHLLGWGVVMSCISLAIFGWSAIYATKSISLLILSAVWLTPLLSIGHLRIRHLRRALWAALLISAVGYVTSDVLRGAIPPFLQSTIFGAGYSEYLDPRPRGFMQETSHFATLLGRDLVVLFLIREAPRPYSPRRLALFLMALAALLAAVGSKGAAVSIVIAVLSVSLTRRQLPYLVAFIPLVAWVGMLQINALTVDIENFTSASTRLTLTFAALAALLANPFGYGYYGFYGAIQVFGGWAMTWLGDRLPLIMTEVADIVQRLNNVSAKSTLMDFGLLFGVPFLVLMYRLVRDIRTSDPRARAALVYLFLSALSTSGHESISLFLGLAVLLRLFPSTTVTREFTDAKHPSLAVSKSLRLFS
jgi:hypothetical protein